MRTHSLLSLKIFVRDECMCVCGGGGGERKGLLLVPSCCSLIQPDPNSRHLDQRTISANFFLMLWWLWRRH